MTAAAITPSAGIYRSASFLDYHSWAAASNHRLSLLRRSPAHLRAYIDQPPPDTTATRIGRAAHCAILEPDDFDARYCVAERCGATTGKGEQCKNTGAVFHAEGGWLCGIHAKTFSGFDESRTVISPEDYRACLAMRDSVQTRSATAGQMLTGVGEVELSVVWPGLGTDVLCKARFDRHTPRIAGGVVVDLKTTRDASRREFERSIFSHGYHRQAALYLDAADAVKLGAFHFVHIAVEKEPPYAVAVYRLTEGAIDAGRAEVAKLLALYAECEERNTWPAYPDRVQDIALPNYAWSQIDEDLAAA